MKPNKWQSALVLLVSFCFLATSCTSTRVMSFPNEQTPMATPNLEVGNTVRVTLKTGEVRKFRVTAMEADALVGKDIRVPYSDMMFLELKKTDGWRSAGLALGIVVAAAALAYAALVVAISNDSD